MTYDRTKAKIIPGEHCRFCGDDSAPLVKTRCCNQWICCDTKFISFSGGGRCQYQHERFSLCHFHFNEGHQGVWQKCEECRKDLNSEDYEEALKDLTNTPRY